MVSLPMATLSNERGFALPAVMFLLTLLAVVVTELAVSMRLEASMIRSYKDGIGASAKLNNIVRAVPALPA